MKFIRTILLLLLSVTITNAQVSVFGKVDHIKPDGIDTLGGIVLTVSGSTAPYTYTWNPGAINTKDITSQTSGHYTVNVTSASSQTYTNAYKIGYKVQWQKHPSTIFRNDSLTTSSTYGNAYSKNTLAASTDGWFEYVFNSLPANHHQIGFADSIAPVVLATDLDYGVYFEGIGQDLYAVQQGASNVLLKSNVKIGDVVRVERVGNIIKYSATGVATRTITVSGVSSKVFKLKAHMIGSTKLNDVGCSFMGFSNQSFANYIMMWPVIKHCSGYGTNDGSVKVSPYIPFTNTYSWTPGGATTSSITTLGVGSYKVRVKDSLLNASNLYYNVGYKVKWTNLDLCSVIGDSLVSSATSNLRSSANSKNVLRGGENGWLEFPIEKITGESYYIGFSLSLSPLMGNSSDINYGINFNSVDNRLYYIVNGVATFLYMNPAIGDIVRVERIGNVINYKINNVTLETITVSGLSSKSLKIKANIQNSDYIARVGCSFHDIDSTYFNNHVQLTSTVKHNNGDGINDGFISVSAKLAGAYTYTWQPGAVASPSISALSNGIYTVTIKDSLENWSLHSFNVGYKAKWTNLSQCFFRNDTIKGTGTNNTFFGNAYSKNILSANTNGWIEFVLKAYPSNASYLGFTDSTSTSVTTLSEMNYGIVIPAFSRTLSYYEGGTTNSLYSYMRLGDVIRIERSGNNILYKVNGVVLRTVTSGTISAKVMKAKVRLQYNNELVNVGCSFAPCTFTMSAGSTQTLTCITPSVVLTGTTNLSGASYTWSPGAITTSTASVSSPGTYTLLVKNTSGECAAQSTVVVVQKLCASASVVDYQNDTLKGNVNLTITGGTAPYNVAWNGQKFGTPDQVYHALKDSLAGIDSLAFKNYINTVRQRTQFNDLEPSTYSVTIYDQANDSVILNISVGQKITSWLSATGVTTSTNTISSLISGGTVYNYGNGSVVTQQGTFSSGNHFAVVPIHHIDIMQPNELSFVVPNSSDIAYVGLFKDTVIFNGDTADMNQKTMFRFNGNGTFDIMFLGNSIYNAAFVSGDHFALRTGLISGKIAYYKNETFLGQQDLTALNAGIASGFMIKTALGNTGATLSGLKIKLPYIILPPPPPMFPICKFISALFPVNVSANPNPVCAGGNLSLAGQLVDLSSNSVTPTSYLWQPINNSAASPAPFSVSASQVYTLYVTYSGCVLKKQVPVTVISVAADAGSDQLITGSPLSIGVASPVSPGTPPFTYNWLPNTDFVAPGGNTLPYPSVNPSSTVIYTLRVTDHNGCYAEDMVTLYTVPISYAGLRKVVDGGFYEVGSTNKVYFKYTGEYNNSGSLSYKIYNPDRTLLTTCSINNTSKAYGDNRFIIDLSPCLTATNNYYLLEVTNEKNERFYLKFKY